MDETGKKGGNRSMAPRLVTAVIIGVVICATTSEPRDANAQDIANEAASFVQALGTDALEVATDKNLTPGEPQTRFKKAKL